MIFHKLYDSNLKLHYDWMLFVKTEEDVLLYQEKFQIPEMKEVVKELQKKTEEPKMHMTNRLAEVIFSLAKLSGNNLGDQMQAIFALQIETMLRFVKEKGGCYVNSLGGMMPFKDLEILDAEVSDTFPVDKDTKIRIIKWEGGTHFYAKHGRVDVRKDGVNKWNTYKLACEASKLWYREYFGKEYKLDFESR